MKKNLTSSPSVNDFFPLVLIVEDDDDTRLMLKYLLEIWKYQVISAATGEQAVLLAESCEPDVVLMDYKLPNIDGLGTTRLMREKPMLADTVIISISGYAEPAAKADALAAGSNDFLVKPINFGELEISLEKHLQSKRKRSEGSVARVL